MRAGMQERVSSFLPKHEKTAYVPGLLLDPVVAFGESSDTLAEDPRVPVVVHHRDSIAPVRDAVLADPGW